MTQVDLSAVQRRAERILNIGDLLCLSRPGAIEREWDQARQLARQAVELVAEVVTLRELAERLEGALEVLDAERLAAVEACERWRPKATEEVSG